MISKCPGQDSRNWKLGDIFEQECANCGYSIEFFKDDVKRTCRQCQNIVYNPKFDEGCASHCEYSEECLGKKDP